MKSLQDEKRENKREKIKRDVALIFASSDDDSMQLGETNEVPGKILDNQKKKKVSKRRQNHVIQNDQIDWPLTLKRNVASNGNDLNANINEGKSLVDKNRPVLKSVQRRTI